MGKRKNKRDTSDSSAVATVAKTGGAFYAIKKLIKGALVVAGLAAVGKAVKASRAT